jgi:hypothetical protein
MSLRRLKGLRFGLLVLVASSLVLIGKEQSFLFGAEVEEKPYLAQTGQEKAGQQPKAQNYTVRRTTSEIKIDGVLDEKAWSEAVVIKLPYEWWPGDNIPTPVNTECLVTFDNKNFYIAFRCFDSDPSKIRAHLMDRDAIDTFIQDDHVSIMLDTFNDERRGFQFRINPLGVQADANFSESEGYEDFSWDAIWSSAGRIEAWGYAIEMAIPFNQLRFPQTSEVQTWGFSAERSYPRNVRHRMTSHRRERNLSCIICQFNKISGIQGISPGLNLEFDPTLTAVRTDKRESFPSGPMEEGKGKADPGLTLRWGITPNLILNATANPDFSQVEADVAQLEVNTRFALRYPEKRPFFLEGADFFLTPFEAVFTRTVADPDEGLKLTGKVGKNAFGVFGAYDKINNLIFPSNQGSASDSMDQDVTSGVFRYRRDIGQNSTLGILYTGRIAEDYYNHVAGFDGFLRLSKTKSINFQYLHSETDYPDDLSLAYGQKLGDFGGDAFTATFLHVSRNWHYGAVYKDLYPGFRADYGYIPRVDIRTVGGMLARVLWGKSDGWFTQIAIGVQGAATYDHQGNLTDRNIDLSLSYLGPLQSVITVEYARNRELYLNQSYELEVFGWDYELKPAGGLRFGFGIQSGDSVDYYNQRRARVLRLMPNAEMGLGRHVNINFMHAFEGLTLGSEKIFEANLSQLRFVFNLNVRTFVRAIVQYLDVTRNPALYLFPVDPKTNTLFTQFLFSYKLNPQTVLFIGYSDNYLGMNGIDITQTDRTFFIKLGYAWTK